MENRNEGSSGCQRPIVQIYNRQFATSRVKLIAGIKKLFKTRFTVCGNVASLCAVMVAAAFGGNQAGAATATGAALIYFFFNAP